MLRSRPPSTRRLLRAAAAVIAALVMSACGDLAAALPPRPSPYPTLERLPSVTPVTPSPTPPPTATATAIAATPTPNLSSALVSVKANMRSGPGLDFPIVATVSAGASVSLSERQGDWFAVRTAAGQEGWMSRLVLTIEPAVAERVPQAQP